MNIFTHKNITLFFVLTVFLSGGFFAQAATVGETVNFRVESGFEANQKPQVSAVLVKSAPRLHFYVERDWWNGLLSNRQQELLASLDALALEFDTNIYPTLTSVFGSEWNPGVDGDSKITILFHSMKEGVGGYFRSTDEYLKLQVPDSNEREMLYLPISQIESSNLFTLLHLTKKSICAAFKRRSGSMKRALIFLRTF
jgi:hypothetical protein